MKATNRVRQSGSSRTLIVASIAAIISLSPAGCGRDAPTANLKAGGGSQDAVAPGRSSSATVLSATPGVIPQVIYGCVNKSSGTIKIADDKDSCTQNEALLAWNIQGPAGPPGPLGPMGPAGATNIRAYSQQATGGTAQRIFCPAGTRVVSGGAYSTSPNTPLIQNFPIDQTGANANGSDIAGWQGATLNFSAPVVVFVLCANP